MFMIKEAFEYQIIITHDTDGIESYYIHSRDEFEHGDEIDIFELVSDEDVEMALDFITDKEGIILRFADGKRIEFFEINQLEFNLLYNQADND